jgi:hypothetical protein
VTNAGYEPRLDGRQPARRLSVRQRAPQRSGVLQREGVLGQALGALNVKPMSGQRERCVARAQPEVALGQAMGRRDARSVRPVGLIRRVRRPPPNDMLH